MDDEKSAPFSAERLRQIREWARGDVCAPFVKSLLASLDERDAEIERLHAENVRLKKEQDALMRAVFTNTYDKALLRIKEWDKQIHDLSNKVSSMSCAFRLIRRMCDPSRSIEEPVSEAKHWNEILDMVKVLRASINDVAVAETNST